MRHMAQSRKQGWHPSPHSGLASLIRRMADSYVPVPFLCLGKGRAVGNILAGFCGAIAFQVPQPVEAAPYFLSGNDLYAYCRSTTGSADRFDCLGYITGVADLLGTMRDAGIAVSCLPNGAVRGQMTDVVQLWLEKHPERRAEGAAGLAMNALSEAFPCPKAKP